MENLFVCLGYFHWLYNASQCMSSECVKNCCHIWQYLCNMKTDILFRKEIIKMHPQANICYLIFVLVYCLSTLFLSLFWGAF